MLNKHKIIGHLGNDPEKISFENGGSITKFSVATTKKWRDKLTNEMKSDTQWHNIVASGRYSDLTHQYLKKGSKVYLEGEPRHRSYGEPKKYITEVHINKVIFLEKTERPTPLDNMPNKIKSNDDDDLPF